MPVGFCPVGTVYKTRGGRVLLARAVLRALSSVARSAAGTMPSPSVSSGSAFNLRRSDANAQDGPQSSQNSHITT